jgi:ABC-type iron transport system FetAB permease component
MDGLVELNLVDLGWALGMMGICLILSRWSNLALEGQLLLATGSINPAIISGRLRYRRYFFPG